MWGVMKDVDFKGFVIGAGERIRTVDPNLGKEGQNRSVNS